jgi:hypothetical protein
MRHDGKRINDLKNSCSDLRNVTTELAIMSNSTKPNDSNLNAHEKQPFDRAKFFTYKRDCYCGMTQDESKEGHGSSFDAELWQAAAKTAEQEKAKYSTPAPRKNDVDLDRE